MLVCQGWGVCLRFCPRGAGRVANLQREAGEWSRCAERSRNRDQLKSKKHETCFLRAALFYLPITSLESIQIDLWSILALEFWVRGRGELLPDVETVYPFLPGWTPNHTMSDCNCFSLHKNAGKHLLHFSGVGSSEILWLNNLVIVKMRTQALRGSVTPLSSFSHLVAELGPGPSTAASVCGQCCLQHPELLLLSEGIKLYNFLNHWISSSFLEIQIPFPLTFFR